MRNGENHPRSADPLAPPDLPGIAVTPEPLSRGPLSAVYRGWDRVHRYPVIVKVLQTTGDAVAADRFRREAAVMARLRHPSIVALYEFHDGSPSALVMEYVPGPTLENRIKTRGRMEPAAAAAVIEEIAAALDCIHAENVVHRDVKPSNILLPKRGPARLTDFGVAHINTTAPLTVRGDVLGTIEYASPEQVQGIAAPDARSDVYSLAAVAYFALTGTPPFRTADSSVQSQLSVMHQQVFSEPPPLRFHRDDLAPGIDAAVRRGLAKAPAARYASAGQFASALRSAVVASAGAPEQAAMVVTRRRTTTFSGGLVGAGLLAYGAFALWNHEQAWQGPSPPHPPQLALRPAPVLPSAAPSAPTPTVKVESSLQAKRRVMPPRVAALPPPSNHPVQERLPAPLRFVKRVVTERPKFRRHPALVASAGIPISRVRAKSLPLLGDAWLSVYARQGSPALGQAEVAVPASLVTVDGKPVPSLAAGGWTTVKSGKHLVAFVPVGHSGFDRNPGLWVTLAPGAHLSRQILLPAAEGAQTRPAALLTASAPAPVQAAPVQVAAASPPVPSPPVPAPAAVTPVGWYTVSGWIVRDASAVKPSLVRTSAQWVKVDGKPVLSLSMGQWAKLPAGKHTVEFQPTTGVGVVSKTWDIDLPALGHLDQHIPLPPGAGSH